MGNSEKEIVTNDALRNEFALFIVLGAVVLLAITSLASWMFGEGTLSLFFKILAPIAVMSGYWLRFRLMQEGAAFEYEFADSFYYMGFGFTLIALLISFLGAAAADTELSTNNLLGNLGIALSTTIFGLLVRVYYVSFKPTSDATLDQLNKELSRSSSRLSRAVEDASSQIQLITDDSLSTLDEKIQHFAERLKGAGDSGQHFRDELTNTRNELSGFSLGVGELQTHLTNLTGATIGLDDKFSKAQSTTSMLTQSTSELNQKIEASGDSIQSGTANIDQFLAQWSGISEHLKLIITTIESSNEHARSTFEQFFNSVSKFSSSLELDADKVKNVAGSLATISNSASSASSSIVDLSEAVDGTKNSLRSVESLLLGIESLSVGLTQIDLESTGKTHSEAAATILQASQQVQRSTKKISELSADIEKYIGVSAQMITAVERSLVNNLKDLNDRIR
jgi:methyl-accepting chemotaxis protein